MKNFQRVLVICLVSLSVASVLDINVRAQTTESVIIAFTKSTTAAQKTSLLAGAGAVVTRDFSRVNSVEASIPQSSIQLLMHNSIVKGVDPNTPPAHIDDLTADTQIHADQAWSTGYTGTGIRVAILDTGIDQGHPEFSGRIAACHTEVAGTTDCTDDNGHGTHVAGLVAAQGSYNQAKGDAPAVSLLIDKVCNSAGSCDPNNIVAGINWAIQNNARVISMSFGGLTASSTQSNCDGDLSTRTNAINTAVSNGITVVAASGNNDAAGNVENPGCISSVIAVGAVDGSDHLASFSDTGAAMSDHGVVAPGVCLTSTWPHYNTTVEYATGCPQGAPTSSYYTWLSGTSMATPLVSGAVALALSKNPSWSPADVRILLFSVSDCLQGPCPNYSVGHGRVNALNMVNACGLPGSCDSSHWAGYDIFSMPNGQPSQSYQANCANCNTIYNVAATVNQAIPVYPSGYPTNPPGCLNYGVGCVWSTWVGMTDEQRAIPDGHLVQMGTSAYCYGNPCTPTYLAWYKLQGSQGATTCPGINVQGGDSIYLHIQNEASVGGANNMYDFYMLDKANGSSCTVNGVYYSLMTTPHFADYIVERPLLGNCPNCAYATLPGAGPTYFSSSQLYCVPILNGKCTPDSQVGRPNEYNIFSMTWQGWFFRDWMRNCGTGSLENVAPYNVDSTGTFKDEWETSNCT